MRRFFGIFCFVLLAASACVSAQETVVYGKRGEREMMMDIYMAKGEERQEETIIYVFGGAFKTGSRDSQISRGYCEAMSERGFTTIAIDYRLGMKDFSGNKIQFVSAIKEAISMAVEDLSMAVAFLIDNAGEWDINPEKIIITGNSAGAITVLETDYNHANGLKESAVLPEDFRFAGVMAFAGAILSEDGKVKYEKRAPAPTMMWHGTEDQIVINKKVELGKLGLYGSYELAKRFEKFDHPYWLRRVVGAGHDVCQFGNTHPEEQIWFIENYIRQGRHLFVDETHNDKDWKSSGQFSGKTGELYKKTFRDDK